jgi:hypothetical protein
MNSMILKEIHRSLLFSKLASKYPYELNIEIKQSKFKDIHKIIFNNDINFIENDTFKSYVFKYNNIIYICIHSTLKYHDDKELIKLKDNIYVNNNVLSQYKAFEDKIIKNISELNDTKLIKKIYVCGYSSGGALAILTSAILAEKYKNMFLVSCFTFGSPKIGNKYFKKYFNKYITCNYRIIISNDLNIQTEWPYYEHISDGLLLENDNIMEIIEKENNVYDNIIKYISKKKINYIENSINIDEYIYRFNNLISIYQSNVLNKEISIRKLISNNDDNLFIDKTNDINNIVLPSTFYT